MKDDENDRFDDSEWSSLVEDWQSQPVRAIDAKTLLAKIKRRSWVIWIMSMLDVVVVLGSGIAGVLLWLRPEQNKNIAVLLLLMCAWGAVMLYFELKIRKGTWRLRDEGNESILDFSIRRCEVAINIGRFFTPALVSAGVVVIGWQIGVYWLSGKMYWPFLIAMLVWFALLIAAAQWFIKRKRKELAKLKQM